MAYVIKKGNLYLSSNQSAENAQRLLKVTKGEGISEDLFRLSFDWTPEILQALRIGSAGAAEITAHLLSFRSATKQDPVTGDPDTFISLDPAFHHWHDCIAS
jgi:hypothetical protein